MTFTQVPDKSAGDNFTETMWDESIRDNLNDLIGISGETSAWTSYTPTWTNVTVGNATQACAFKRLSSLVAVRIKLTFGTTTSISGDPEFTLPDGDSFNAAYDVLPMVGTGIYSEQGSGSYPTHVVRSGSTAARARLLHMGTGGGLVFITSGAGAAVPFTWGQNDVIAAAFVYEPA